MPKSQWPVIPPERGDDLHNLDMASNADLVLFMAGNQFMAMPDIVAAFQEDHPEVKRIFYETLPPGLELNQILSGGAIFRGEELRVLPDIYTSVSQNAMDRLANSGVRFEAAYATNPICVPTRYSLQTGLMPSAIGMRLNSDDKHANQK